MENMGDNTLWPSSTQYQAIGSGNYGPDQNTINSEWISQYRGVRQANSFRKLSKGGCQSNIGRSFGWRS